MKKKFYVEDPLCGFDVSISMWRAGNQKNLKNLPKELPVHMVELMHKLWTMEKQSNFAIMDFPHVTCKILFAMKA